MPTPPDDAHLLFDAHLDVILERYQRAMEACGHRALVIDAGAPTTWFLDDIAASWRTNPHFRLLTPCAPAEGCAVLLRPGETPVLLHLRPDDYWHLPPSPPEGAWTARFDIRPVADDAAREHAIRDWLANDGARAARIGPIASDATGAHNPAALMARVDFERACKTPYEHACMRAASRRAVRGHRAAAQRFLDGASEYEIHLAYLAATGHEDGELPYHNIVALDRHGAVLHYQHRQRQAPAGGARSFLIDAGADADGYAADVTRTHARDGGQFADLVDAMDVLQRGLVARIRPGLAWEDLHHQAHVDLAALLVDAGICKGSAQTVLERGITRSFLPHGLGHLIGTQTHDAGGRLQDETGAERLPSDRYPALRLTRTLAADWTVTVEPGLYFIPLLLEELRAGADASLVDWKLVDALAPCGGIRIEDDVRVTADGVENLTRDAFEASGR
ncbi:MAG TPA: Xaa-Pro dipeptidase [Pseudomonadales bacterium]|nr:Xaa-Pro dipeptidase [Pseudomonadales bacterium]